MNPMTRYEIGKPPPRLERLVQSGLGPSIHCRHGVDRHLGPESDGRPKNRGVTGRAPSRWEATGGSTHLQVSDVTSTSWSRNRVEGDSLPTVEGVAD